MLKVQTPPFPPASLISIFLAFLLLLSQPSSPSLLSSSSFPVFPGLGCHQRRSYPFPHSPTYTGMNMISHEAKLEHEHRQNRSLLIGAAAAASHLYWVLCRKELNHWVEGSPVTAGPVSPLLLSPHHTLRPQIGFPLAAWCHIMVKIIT